MELHVNTITTPKRRSQAQRIEISDQRMLQAAMELIFELGSQKTTLKDVGERAGYSRGLAGARFGSKEGLFLQLIRLCQGLWFEDLRRFVEGKTGMNAFLARFDALEHFMLNDPSHARVMNILHFESLGLPSERKNEVAKYYATIRREVCQQVEEGIDVGEISDSVNPRYFAEYYSSFAMGLTLQWVVTPEAFEIKQLLCNAKQDMLLILTSDAQLKNVIS